MATSLSTSGSRSLQQPVVNLPEAAVGRLVLHLLGEEAVVDFAAKIHKRPLFLIVGRNAQLQRRLRKQHPQLLLNLLEAGGRLQHVALQQVVLQLRQDFLVGHVHQLQNVEAFQLEVLGRQQLAATPRGGGGCAAGLNLLGR